MRGRILCMKPKAYLETTIRDEIVNEVRKVREDYARQFNFDLDAISRDLRQKQQASGRRVVSLPPRCPKPVQHGPPNNTLALHIPLKRGETPKCDS